MLNAKIGPYIGMTVLVSKPNHMLVRTSVIDVDKDVLHIYREVPGSEKYDNVKRKFVNDTIYTSWPTWLVVNIGDVDIKFEMNPYGTYMHEDEEIIFI